FTRLILSSRQCAARPPLFPYTTLFRSGIDGNAARFEEHEQMIDQIGRLALERPVVLAETGNDDLDGLFAEFLRAPRHTAIEKQPDRKSTRLNSSHVKISYAVFCLKKNG